MFFFAAKHQAYKRGVSLVLSFVFALMLISLSGTPASSVHATPGDSLGLLEIEVNKPVNAVVDLNQATIHISLPYGALYQMLNVRTNPGAAATLYRSNGTTAISFAASGINKGDAKMDQFSTSGTTLYYLVVADKNESSNSRTYEITVKVEMTLPSITGMGASDKYLPLNIRGGEHAWDVMGASKIGNGSTTGSVEGPNTPSSYSGKTWSQSVYDRSGDYPVASTVNEAWLGDNMYLQTIGRKDTDALEKYGIANIPGTDKLGSDILRFHEFLPFVTPDGVSRDDGDRGAVGSDRQRLEIKSNTNASSIDANSKGGDIMTHHWRFMLPSETLRFQNDVGDHHAGDFIAPRRFWHIFQLKEIAGNAAGQPVTTLSLVSSGGKGHLEFRNNPDGDYADRIKPLFTIPFEQVVDRWLDFDVTILTADHGYVYGKLVDLETGQVLFEGGMTAETYRRPEVQNPITGRDERGDLPVEPGQQNRSKWGLYRGMYNGAGDTAYADEFQSATMYLSDIYLIKRDKDSYIFPDGWDPKAQPKDIVAWARPKEITASDGTPFGRLGLPSQLDVTLSTGLTEKVNVTWSSAGYNPDAIGTSRIYGEFTGTGLTNPKNIKPYIDITLRDLTPPVTIALIDPIPQNGWLNTEATVTLSVYNDRSGVAKTEYRLGDPANWQPYAGPIAFTNEGISRLEYRSIDAVGNIEQSKELIVRMDKSKPVFGLTGNGEPFVDGAVYSDDRSIALNLNANDALSGIASQELTLDGKRLENGASIDLAGKLGPHLLRVVITDQAGNTTDASFGLTMIATPEGVANLMNRYVEARELKGPLVDQLRNSLKQALHQLDKGDRGMAAKHMEDFLKHLNNEPMADQVSEAAISVLRIDATALMKEWSLK
ncbi:OmpL47-type beta-barrel domain-containing protein [Paenibacillus sp. HJGM_3]|uniref:OmpL47-type beta-barrel domain-containing protein n=1 Tax=Paenibacillus sp. HJGM_3 TaxID=3379816 RepID=UPI00385ABF77